MRAKNTYVVGDSAVSTGDNMLKVLKMMKFTMTDALDHEEAMKIWEIF